MESRISVHTKEESGFTLIELLLVVAIIGILAVVAITYLNTARDKAREVTFKASASSIKSAATLCCDSGGVLNSAASGSLDVGDAPIPVCPSLADAIYPQSVTIDSIDVTSGCDLNTGEFVLTVNPNTGAGSCTAATLTHQGASFTGCN